MVAGCIEQFAEEHSPKDVSLGEPRRDVSDGKARRVHKRLRCRE